MASKGIVGRSVALGFAFKKNRTTTTTVGVFSLHFGDHQFSHRQ
jgi:hypothetical protein